MILMMSICLGMVSCQNSDMEQIDSPPDIALVKAGIDEVMNVYFASKSEGTSYESAVEKIRAISKKYGIRFEPVTKEVFDARYSINAGGSDRMATPCGNNIASSELVHEGGGCFGKVWHYADGSTFYSQFCECGSGNGVGGMGYCNTESCCYPNGWTTCV